MRVLKICIVLTSKKLTLRFIDFQELKLITPDSNYQILYASRDFGRQQSSVEVM